MADWMDDDWNAPAAARLKGAAVEDDEDPFLAMAAMLDGTDGSEQSWEVGSQGSNRSSNSGYRPKLVESGVQKVGPEEEAEQQSESSRLESAPRLLGAKKLTRSPSASRPYTFPALGTRFVCTKRATVRASVEMDSEKAGFVEVGEELVALECKLNDRGQLRVRFERGWTSTTTLGGSVLLEPVGEEDDEDDGGFNSVDVDEDAGPYGGLNSGFVAAPEPEPEQAVKDQKDQRKQSLPRSTNSLGQESSPSADNQDSSPHRVVYTIEEEEDQEPIQPMLYMAAKKAVVRSASRLDSPRIGLMSRGELILVTHTKMVGETLRLRFGRGWTSAIGGDGRTIFIAENNPNRHYRAVKLGRVSVGFEESSETVGTITRNSVIEGVETREILPRGDKPRYRIRLKSGGWATEVAKSGVRLLTLVTFQRPDEPARPTAPVPSVGGLAGAAGFDDSPRKMIKRSGISSGVTITFGKGPLGMGLAENLEWMSASAVGAFATVVERFNLLADGSKGPVEDSNRVHIGDLLVAVSGTDVRSEDHTNVLRRIRACPRPFTITFCEPRLLAGLVLEVAPPRARRLSGGMLREQSLPRVRSQSLHSTSDGTVAGDYSSVGGQQQQPGQQGAAYDRRTNPNHQHRVRRRHRSDPRNSRVSAADRVLVDAEDDPDDDKTVGVERRSSAASFGSATLMPIEDIDGEYNEPLSGGSDQTYQSSTSNMFDPLDVDENGLGTRDGDWAGKAPDQIAGRIDYDSASDVGDEGAFGPRMTSMNGGSASNASYEKGWDDETRSTGSDWGTSSVGGSLRSFQDRAQSEGSDLDRGLMAGEMGEHEISNPLAGLQGGLLGTVNPLAGVAGGLFSPSGGPSRNGQRGGAASPHASPNAGVLMPKEEPFRKDPARRSVEIGLQVEEPFHGLMMIDAAEVLHKTGMLSKRGGIRKAWKPRYFVLSKTTLRWYERQNAALPLGAMSLSHAIIEEVPFHEMGKLYCFCARTPGQVELYMHANTKQAMDEWIDIFTAAAALKGDDRLAQELITEATTNELSVRVKHQAKNVTTSIADGVEKGVSKMSKVLCCCGRGEAQELWAPAFNASAAAASAPPGTPTSLATHNPMQLLPMPQARRAPMGAGQPIPHNVHNPLLPIGGHSGGHSPASRSVVNPLRPLDSQAASQSRVTHNPMKSAGGLMRQGYVLPDVTEDVDEDDPDDFGFGDRMDNV